MRETHADGGSGMTAVAEGRARRSVGPAPSTRNRPRQPPASDRARLFVQPVLVIIIVGGVVVWAFSRDLTATSREPQRRQHRDPDLAARADHAGRRVSSCDRRAAGDPAHPARVHQAGTDLPRHRQHRPGRAGDRPARAVLPRDADHRILDRGAPVVFYSLLPVLRNTILGIQQVDRPLIDAGRGQGMSAAGGAAAGRVPARGAATSWPGCARRWCSPSAPRHSSSSSARGGLGNPHRHRLQAAATT